MKRPPLLLAVAMLIASPSWAGRNVNGMMLVHTDDSIVYTATADYCQSATPGRCEDFVNTSHKTPDEATVVWLMAAFVASSSPAVTALQFGIHHNLPPTQGYIDGYSACGPQLLELPDTGWPELNDCGNLVAYGVPVYDHAFPFYWFAVWHDDDTYYFGTRTYPSTNEAKFVDDGSPPIEDLCFNFAAMRWNVPGEMDCIPDQPHSGACCFLDGSCIYTPMDRVSGYLPRRRCALRSQPLPAAGSLLPPGRDLSDAAGGGVRSDRGRALRPRHHLRSESLRADPRGRLLPGRRHLH